MLATGDMLYNNTMSVMCGQLLGCLVVSPVSVDDRCCTCWKILTSTTCCHRIAVLLSYSWQAAVAHADVACSCCDAVCVCVCVCLMFIK